MTELGNKGVVFSNYISSSAICLQLHRYLLSSRNEFIGLLLIEKFEFKSVADYF